MIVNKQKENSTLPHIFDAIQDLGNIDYVKSGQVYKNETCSGVLISAESELDLLDDYPVGTLAFTAGFTTMWQKDVSGSWVSVI